MVPSDNDDKQHHHIEAKGPDSFWVHRFRGNSKFSRIVYFARDQQEAERYIKAMEQSAELQG